MPCLPLSSPHSPTCSPAPPLLSLSILHRMGRHGDVAVAAELRPLGASPEGADAAHYSAPSPSPSSPAESSRGRPVRRLRPRLPHHGRTPPSPIPAIAVDPVPVRARHRLRRDLLFLPMPGIGPGSPGFVAFVFNLLHRYRRSPGRFRHLHPPPPPSTAPTVFRVSPSPFWASPSSVSLPRRRRPSPCTLPRHRTTVKCGHGLPRPRGG